MRVPLRESLILAAALVSCAVGPRVTHPDPMLAVDLVITAALGAWAVLFARDAWRGHKLGRALTARSTVADVAGVQCRVVLGGAMEAFALGALRPRIYVSERLLTELPRGELRAVVLHEEYHRRTHAPLRAAALRSWLQLAGWSRWARARLADRLADLEREADAFAMAHGTSPATLAAALVRTDALVAGSGASFGAAADRRLEALLAAAAGGPSRSVPLPPLEWLVPAASLVLPVACYLLGIAPLP